jgi:hypothetical protein
MPFLLTDATLTWIFSNWRATVEECFARKSGTTINLFIRNLPRLSVDIDRTCRFRIARPRVPRHAPPQQLLISTAHY